MIYLDTSVALAKIFNEPAQPEAAFWDATFVASRLVQYEVWNRLHARRANKYRHERARSVIRRLRLIEMTPNILVRALRPFRVAVRTLDGLHLATMQHLQGEGEEIELASYDTRLVAAAKEMGFPTVEP